MLKTQEEYETVTSVKDQIPLIPDMFGGELMPMQAFIDQCMDFRLHDHGGFGFYAVNENYRTNLKVWPSEIRKGNVNTGFKYVIWFPRHAE